MMPLNEWSVWVFLLSMRHVTDQYRDTLAKKIDLRTYIILKSKHGTSNHTFVRNAKLYLCCSTTWFCLKDVPTLPWRGVQLCLRILDHKCCFVASKVHTVGLIKSCQCLQPNEWCLSKSASMRRHLLNRPKIRSNHRWTINSMHQWTNLRV